MLFILCLVWPRIHFLCFILKLLMWKKWRKFIEEQLFEHLIVFASLIEHVLIFKIIRLKKLQTQVRCYCVSPWKTGLSNFWIYDQIYIPLIPQFHRNEFAHEEDYVSIQFSWSKLSFDEIVLAFKVWSRWLKSLYLFYLDLF